MLTGDCVFGLGRASVRSVKFVDHTGGGVGQGGYITAASGLREGCQRLHWEGCSGCRLSGYWQCILHGCKNVLLCYGVRPYHVIYLSEIVGSLVFRQACHV